MQTTTTTERMIELWEEIFSGENIKTAFEGMSNLSAQILNDYSGNKAKELIADYPSIVTATQSALCEDDVGCDQLISFAANALVTSVAAVLKCDDLGLVSSSIRCIEHSQSFTESVYVFACPISNVLFETYLVFESNESDAYAIIEEFIKEREDEEDAEHTLETMLFAGTIHSPED